MNIIILEVVDSGLYICKCCKATFSKPFHNITLFQGSPNQAKWVKFSSYRKSGNFGVG
jgi:hypothetical protein